MKISLSKHTLPKFPRYIGQGWVMRVTNKTSEYGPKIDI